ncbi:DUF1499 domain-containing protein [Paraglaciecola aquimarina]|uniref:DUF1499 domain-containing protein n=1 Tax=Paraglaciecola aquimarina TaxID=1235557 RepID=A0ABU3SW76_9ALTE|nr:DUF1499 domain-containing protein [Paraglaciecola aquimarina]MDU0354268.1 DUF1499 domain-containing protein [Paraglaciecola aquimarina]
MKTLTQLVLLGFVLLSGCTSVSPELGVKNGQLTPCPEKPNCVSSLTEDKSQYVEPMLHDGQPRQIKSDILQVLAELDNSQTTVSKDNYIRAEFTSTVFRFVDDVEFYFPETTSNGTQIHLRSASRVGHSDFGVNRKRIELIRSKFENIRQETDPSQ